MPLRVAIIPQIPDRPSGVGISDVLLQTQLASQHVSDHACRWPKRRRRRICGVKRRSTGIDVELLSIPSIVRTIVPRVPDFSVIGQICKVLLVVGSKVDVDRNGPDSWPLNGRGRIGLAIDIELLRAPRMTGLTVKPHVPDRTIASKIGDMLLRQNRRSRRVENATKRFTVGARSSRI